MAADLAGELKAMQLQKDALEQRNMQLEAALLQTRADQSSARPSDRPERPSLVSHTHLEHPHHQMRSFDAD